MSGFPIINGILKVVTFVLLLLIVLLYISPYISPEKSAFLSLIGLGAPIIMLSVFILTIYWIICWDKAAIVCLVIFVSGIGYTSRLIQFPCRIKQTPAGQLLKVLTFNAHFFTTPEYKDVLDSSMDCIDTLDAGIICFQEFATSKQAHLEKINDRLSKYPYNYCFEQEDKSSKVKYYSAIYSKYKIINKGELNFNGQTSRVMYVDIIYRNDTIRVLNNHMQSNNVNSDDIKFLTGEGESLYTENSIFRIFSISKKITVNNGLRASQADSVNQFIKSTPYSIIVCGDLNVTPISYTYNSIRGDLQDAFINRGSRYGYTYKAFSNLLRIDYVFHSEKFETVSYSSPDILWSDHKPVIVTLKYNK